jgi:hypothetical protein
MGHQAPVGYFGVEAEVMKPGPVRLGTVSPELEEARRKTDNTAGKATSWRRVRTLKDFRHPQTPAQYWG